MIMEGLKWQCSGSLGGVDDALPPDASSRAALAVRAMSRMSPLEFAGDKRGRLQDLMTHIADGLPGRADASLPFYSHSWIYDGGRTARAALPVVSRRISFPQRAAVVPLADWLPPSVAEAFNHPRLPADLQPDDIPKGYFAASQKEWRACCRRMVRCSLAQACPASRCHPRHAAGAFGAPKNADRDRFIGDRRPRNATERSIGRVCLPYAPRLRRIRLRPDQGLRIAMRDVKDCFYVYRIDDVRVPGQVIGPRVPASWFARLDREDLDDCDDFEAWCQQDLWRGPGDAAPDPSDFDHENFRDICLQGVIMGDLNAVYAVECAHRRQLLAAGALREDQLLMSGLPFPDGDMVADVYIDDLAYLVICALVDVHNELAVEQVARADGMYEAPRHPDQRGEGH